MTLAGALRRTTGGLALVFGTAILAWVAYNLFVERQPAFQHGDLGIPVLLVTAGWVMLQGRSPGARRPGPRGQDHGGAAPEDGPS